MTINQISFRIIASSGADRINSPSGVSSGVNKCARIAFDKFNDRANLVSIYREGIDPKPWFLRLRFTKCTINNQEIWINTKSFCKRFSCKTLSEKALRQKLAEILKSPLQVVSIGKAPGLLENSDDAEIRELFDIQRGGIEITHNRYAPTPTSVGTDEFSTIQKCTSSSTFDRYIPTPNSLGSRGEIAYQEVQFVRKNQAYFGLPTLTTIDGITYVLRTKCKKEGHKKLGKGGHKTAKIALRYKDGKKLPDTAVVLIVKRDKTDTDEEWAGNCLDIDHEIEIMKELDGDPNFLQLLAVHKIDGASYRDQKYYIIVDKGKDLKKVLREESSTEGIKWVYACQMANALAALNDKGYIHGDIKPENFIKLDTGDVVLSDFGGTAHETDEVRRLKYTAYYPSPEQAVKYDRSDPLSLCFLSAECTTTKADSWALGYSLYLMYHNKNGPEIINKPIDWLDVLMETMNITQNRIDERLKKDITDSRIRFIIWQLLQVDPNKRISAAFAEEQLSAL